MNGGQPRVSRAPVLEASRRQASGFIMICAVPRRRCAEAAWASSLGAPVARRRMGTCRDPRWAAHRPDRWCSRSGRVCLPMAILHVGTMELLARLFQFKLPRSKAPHMDAESIQLGSAAVTGELEFDFQLVLRHRELAHRAGHPDAGTTPHATWLACGHLPILDGVSRLITQQRFVRHGPATWPCPAPTAAPA
jgi:hypothetical protein